MSVDVLLYAVRLTEWEVGRGATKHQRSLADDAERCIAVRPKGGLRYNVESTRRTTA
jgi:hypothetical protein